MTGQSAPVSIGIDYTAAYEQGAGIGRLVRDLIGALAEYDTTNDYRLFVGGATRSTVPTAPQQENFSWHPTRLSPRWLARIWHKARVPLPVELFVGRVNLFHATDFTLPPTLPGCKTIVTVHDLSYVKAPETAHPAQKAYLDKAVPLSVQRADHVIADSAATKQDLIDVYNTPSEKISVLLSGLSKRFQRVEDAAQRREVRRKYNIPHDVPYIFSIGTVQPRKNYGRAIAALQALGEAFNDLHYVVAGGKGWLDNPIYETVNTSGLNSRVHFIGFVDDADVPVLYSDATLTWYVSLYEGFGFPVLESMACGTPVLTSTVSSLPEVAGDAAMMVDPTDTDAIAAAMRDILSNEDQQQTMIAAGYEQIKAFTWERAARELRDIYEMVLGL
jgi:glycosyltransferase involved in cell wall biosynthesis